MDDLARLRQEYKKRQQRLTGRDVYTCFNSPHLFAIQQRQRTILKVLRKSGFTTLSGSQILEIGCGSGGVLAEFLNFDALPINIYGIDLLSDRLLQAFRRLPGSHLINADGQFLPVSSQTFDIVMQFTALSSILDPDIRKNICLDMLRVLRTSGLILWYDFWLNPTNRQTHGIRPEEIRKLFPGCRYDFHKITLAPPIARRIVPISWTLAMLLEKIKIFNSHYLVAIRPIC